MFRGNTTLERLKEFVGRMTQFLYSWNGHDPILVSEEAVNSHGDVGEVEAYVHTLLISALVIGGQG
jgi:hypothetical protein